MAYSSKSVFAALPRTQRGTPLVLGGDPKGKNFLYAVGNSVVIRNIDEPQLADVYTEHSCAVNVAKYSPSGFYVASGDVSGKVRIWDTVNKEHILKNEFQPLGGTVKDIAWSADSQRMCAVGDGRERFGHVFMADTGTSVGEISGQAKTINSVDFRPSRPFRIVTASEDNTVAVFEGPPFKFKCTKQEHSRFVQAVRYSPDGSVFASAGFDGKIFVYEGSSSELKCEIGSPAHKGGVYGVAWSADGKRLLSCSGDKTCKLWDVETAQVVSEFAMGTTVDDQQVSCLWQGPHMLSVSLSGFINYLNVDDPSKPLRVVKGHNKPITALALDEDKKEIYTASHDGFVTEWNAETGENDRIGGVGHGNQINGLRCFEGSLYSCGIDDSLRKATRGVGSEPGAYAGEAVALGSQPRAMDVYREKSLVVIGTVKEVLVLKDDRKVSSLTAFYEPSAVSVNQINGDVAVGGAADNKVHVYTLRDQVLTPGPELKHLGPITDCKYSPDGKYLVACDTNRKVIVYSVEDYKLAHNKEWGFHTARVNCVAWSDDSGRVASGSLDTSIIVWTLSQPNKHLVIKNAHPQSQITSLAWLDGETIVSVGQDCNTKLWTVPVA